jgi:predicted cupin superfamily sugar epimerase
MGTTVAPGFETADFETAQRQELLKQYPERRELILNLTQ